MLRRVIETNVRILYPLYDFKTGKIMTSDKRQDSYPTSPSAQGLTTTELDPIGQPTSQGPNNATGVIEEETFMNRGMPLNAIVEEVNESRSIPSGNLNSGDKFE